MGLGTVIFVSHDRYFLEKLATKVFEIKDGGLVVYPGNYAEYVRDQEEAAAGKSAAPVAASAVPGKVAPVQTAAVAQSAPVPAGEAPKAKRLNPIKLKQMQDRCNFLEEEVPRIEGSIAHTEAQLGNYVSAEETQRQSDLLAELREQLNAFTAEWEELMMALEEQAELG